MIKSVTAAACVLAGFLTMLGVAASTAYAEGDLQKIAADDLNEFDVAASCYGAEYTYEAAPAGPADKRYQRPESRFGYVSGSSGGKPEFVYIASRYYVHTGPYGDPGGCEFRRTLYRLTDKNLFKREAIDEAEFARIKSELEPGRRAYTRSNPGKMFGRPQLGPADSVGDCLFPIQWYSLLGQDYALLSVVRGDTGVVDYVRPHYQRAFDGNPSTCLAWGERYLTNSSIVSSEINFLPLNGDLLFVEMANYQKGFVFKPGPDFQCIPGRDVFSRHILVKKKLFDAEIRPGLEEVFSGRKPADASGVVSFLDSVFLSQEFAATVAGFAEEKGCR